MFYVEPYNNPIIISPLIINNHPMDSRVTLVADFTVLNISFIFRKHFILVRVTVNLGISEHEAGLYTVDLTPVHARTHPQVYKPD